MKIRNFINRAPIFEVFSSIQGEGAHLGERQIFVRFGGCNLHCCYCDEPESIPLDAGEMWDIERLKSVILLHQRQRPHRAISWTGGEPLLYPEFLSRILPWAREEGFLNYLETNGMHVSALEKLRSLFDVIAVDLKLPSATDRSLWSRHEAFLKEAGAKAFAKVVLTQQATDQEFRRVIACMEKNAPAIPLFLQPATQVSSARLEGKEIFPIEAQRMIRFLVWARQRLSDVRLMPQWHPIWSMK